MKNRLTIKTLSLLLAAIMVISLMPAAFADDIVVDEPTVTEPDSGETVTTDEPAEEPVSTAEEPVSTGDEPVSTGDEPVDTPPAEVEPSTGDEQPEEEWIGLEWLNIKSKLKEGESIDENPDPTADEDEGEKADSADDANPADDVETAEDWEKTIPYSKLNGSKSHDLITVALSQVGYHESKTNYVLSARGKHKGYSRYGQWYGIPYGDWCAMFVSFCLNYAGISASAFPRSASCTSWMSTLKSMKKLADPGYEPKPGDLIFFKFWQSSGSDHVGIVYSTYTDANGIRRVKVIEGNSSDRVQILTYPLTSSKIAGYGLLTDTYGPDFTSKQLLVVTSDSSILTKGTVIGQYGSAYLLNFKSAKDAESAYDYYTGKVDAVAPDTKLTAAEGDDDPLSLLNELFRVRAEEVYEQAMNYPDSMTGSTDSRPLIALIDTAVTDKYAEQYSVITPMPVEETAPETELAVKPSDAVNTDEQDVIIPPAEIEETEAVEPDPTHGDKILAYIREENPNARVMCIEALDAEGKGSAASVYAAMRLAMNKGARIINLSLSAYSNGVNAVLASVINDAADLGITVVVSAGNSGKNAKFFTPANVGSAVTVGSCDKKGDPLDKSNYGDGVDYYVVSGTTSEAAARFTGMISKSDALPDYGTQVRKMMNYRIFLGKKVVDDTVPPIPNENEDGDVSAGYPMFGTDDIAHGVCGSCSWLIDRDGSMVIWPTSGDTGTLTDIYDAANIPWYGSAGKVYTVRFMGTVKTRKGCVSLFAGMNNLTDINFTGFDMSGAVNLSNMFEGDGKLKSVDLSKTKVGTNTLDEAGLTDIFKGCASLKYINLSGLDTGNVTSLGGLFTDCASAEEINLSGMANPNVTDMAGLFSDQTGLKVLNLTGFSTGNVTTMAGMFENCSALTEVDLSGFNTDKCVDFSGMFRGCTGIHELNISNFTTNKANPGINMDGMFEGCTGLVKLDMSNDGFRIPDACDPGLSGCVGLEEITLGYSLSGVSVLPNGLWRSAETGNVITGGSLSAGTYERVYSLDPDYGDLPDVNISVADLGTIQPTFAQKGKNYTYNKKSGTDFEVIAAKDGSGVYSTEKEAFTLTYPGAARSVYGDKYDVVITFTGAKFNNSISKGHAVVSGGGGLTLMGGGEYDVTVKLVNKDSKAAAAKKSWNKSHTEKVDDSAVWTKDEKGKYLTPEVGTYLFDLADGVTPGSGFTLAADSSAAAADASVASFVWKSDSDAEILSGLSLRLFGADTVSPDGERLAGVSVKIQKGTLDSGTGEVSYTDMDRSTASWVSGSTAHTVGLVPGQYRLIGVSSPDNYGTVDALPFSVSVSGQLVISGQGAADSLTVNVPIEKSNIKLVISDSGNAETLLTGATFSLTGTSDSGAEINVTTSSDDTGVCDLGLVPVGSYTLAETSAPKGYVPPDFWTVTVNRYGCARITDSQGISVEGTFTDCVHGRFGLKNEKEVFSLTVKTAVKYGLPDGNETFDFNLTLTDTAGNPVVLSTDKLSGDVSYDAVSSVYKLKIRAGTDGIRIPLPEGTKYTVTESLGSYYDGCTVTKTVGGVSAAQNSSVVSDTLITENHIVTYTNIPNTVSVNVTNAWDNMGQENLTVPDSVTVQLLADGADTGMIAVLTEDQGWEYCFTDMPMYLDGQAVRYTVEEAEVTGWSATASAEDAGSEQSIRVTNVPSRKLTLSADSDAAELTVSFTQADGSDYKLPRAVINFNSQLDENADQPGYTVTLNQDDAVTLNLPQGVKYTVKSENDPSAVYSTTGVIGVDDVTVHSDSFRLSETAVVTAEIVDVIGSGSSGNAGIAALLIICVLAAGAAVVFLRKSKHKR